MSFLPLPRLDPDFASNIEPPLATAKWLDAGTVASALHMALDTPSADILLGQINVNGEAPTYIGYGDDRHLITIAGSRSGKGTSLIIPNLLHYNGAVVVIDPKGENAAKTAKYRAEVLGQHVVILDPFGVCDQYEGLEQEYFGAFNPLTTLDETDREIVDEATALADALVMKGNGANKDPHWDESARMLIKATILFVLAYEPDPSRRNFVRVKELLTVGYAAPVAPEEDQNPDIVIPPSFEEFILALKHADDFGGAIAAAGHALQDMGEKELGSILSTVRRHLEFISSLPMQEQLTHSSFDPASLKTAPHATSIYLVLPEYRLAGHARWLRLMITVLLNAIQRVGINQTNAQTRQILFILDEFATLGHLEAIERAAGYIAGFGVKLWSVLQDLSQLKDLYAKRWETFIGNAGVLTAFANTDTATLEYLSKRLGESEITKTESSLTQTGGTNNTRAGLGKMMGALTNDKAAIESLLGNETAGDSSGWSSQASPRKSTTALMRPDEIARYFARKSEAERTQELLLCLIAGVQPIRLQKCFYYLDETFKTRSHV